MCCGDWILWRWRTDVCEQLDSLGVIISDASNLSLILSFRDWSAVP